MTALQPLYVDSAASGVRLEGPALAVTCPARADTRVPLRRLARVVVRGAVPFATDALLGCLDAGVPVTFVALDGRVVGYCIGRETRVQLIGPLLERLVNEPGWPEIVGRWAQHIESLAMRQTCHRLQVEPGLDTRPATVWALLARQIPSAATPGAEASLRRLDGLMRAHLVDLLQRAGIPSRFRGRSASALDLRPYFANALGWHLWPVLARLLEYQGGHPWISASRRWPDGRRADRDAHRRRRFVVAYEAAVPAMEAKFRRMLACLEGLLREHLG
ncbi:MAG: CRISPR-associated endonuclease Cas1 [Acetobacteraceae bacterium]